jgi:predicted dehydrogenase
MGLRIKILGRHGAIGKVHERIFKKLGAEIVDDNADAVSICLPTFLHLDTIRQYASLDIPVLCEKPLFWWEDITCGTIETYLKSLKQHPHQIFLNTPNIYLLDAVKDRMDIGNAYSFSLSFHTNGKYKKKDIGTDLLPHGISMLLHLFGKQEINRNVEMFNHSSYWVKFDYGKVHVNFNFHENAESPKWMSFGTNGHKFYRRQEGDGESYRVWIRDGFQGDEVEVEDPFYISLSKFYKYCHEGGKTEFDLAADNMRLMGRLLL